MVKYFLILIMDANKLRPGHAVEIDNQPYIIVSAVLRQQPRLATKVITKMKNILNGSVLEMTFTGGDQVKEADIIRRSATFLYSGGDEYHFMEKDNYEQFSFEKEELGDMVNFLKEDTDVIVLKHNDKPQFIELPTTITMKIIETEPGVKGDSATGKMKNATIETGLSIKVPLFIKEGDMVTIDTQTGEYRQRN